MHLSDDEDLSLRELFSEIEKELLKKEMGINTQDLIHQHVIERSKHSLLNSNASIAQIAYQLGFEYPQYFSRLFKKKTGMTPVEYRSSNLQH